MPARKLYHLRSEIQRTRSKHPPFDLVLPNVKLPAGVTIAEGESENEYDEITVQIPSAQLLPDNVVSLSSRDPIAAAKLILGEQNYEHMIQAGGSSTILFQIIQQSAGVDDMGESEPSSDS